MTEVFVTPNVRFDEIDFARTYPANYLEWAALDVDMPLRMAVIDAPVIGEERGTFLLLHGQPSWSHLYEQWIPRLSAAGYRCIAPDLIGFGRSDKPTDEAWYSYERHCESVCTVIDTLDLTRIHLVVQDWAGPIGLRQAVDSPERFSRLFIFNTWLHSDTSVYNDAIRWWRTAAADPAQLGGDMPIGDIVMLTMGRTHDEAHVRAAFEAPFPSFESKAGARAFPAMLPFAQPDVGGAVEQERCRSALAAWSGCPVHVIFSDADPIFTFEQGESWAAEIPGATLDRIHGAGHFVQCDAPEDCLEVIGRHVGHAI